MHRHKFYNLHLCYIQLRSYTIHFSFSYMMWHLLGLCTRDQVSWQLHHGFFSCYKTRSSSKGPVGFYLCLAYFKHLILCHVCHLGLIVSWERSQRGQDHWLLFFLQSIHLGLPRLNISVIPSGKWRNRDRGGKKEKRKGGSERGGQIDSARHSWIN